MAAPSAERRRRLAIVGASCRGAAFSARRAGFDVVTADLFADEDLRVFAEAHRVDDYPHGLEQWLARVDAQAWIYTGALENHPDLVDRMAGAKPLWGVAGDALRASRDFWELAVSFERAGLCVPETRSNPNGLPLGGEWLCKTYRGSSGSGVWALDSPDALQRARDREALFQRSLANGAGWPGAALFALAGAESVTLGVTRQVVGDPRSGAGPFQYAGSIHPPPAISAAVADELLRIRRVLADDLRLRGLVGVDLWVDDQHAWILEINPRYTASVEVLERATGYCALLPHARAWGGGRRAPTLCAVPRPAPAVGKLIYFAKQDVHVSDRFSTWALAQSRRWPGLADVPAPGQFIPAGRPVVTLLAEGAEPEHGPLFARRVAELEGRLYADA